MRVIVLGVGGVGAMAAWQLAAAGCEVIALEQHQIDHDRGSSHGDSRIVRRVYHDPDYTRMMGGAYALWSELMADAGDNRLFVPCGGIYFGPAYGPDLAEAEAALNAADVPYERFDAAECARRYPAVRLEPDEAALYEPSMGYARASRAVRAAVALAARLGATVREASRAAAIEPGSAGVAVRLDTGERIEADRLVVAAGPWTGPLLHALGVELPITVTRQPYVHLEPARRPELFGEDRFPVWIDCGANAYGFPRLGDLPGVKIGIHDFGEATDPESVARGVRPEDRATAIAYAEHRFPDLSDTSVYEKVCLYSVTPDTHFIIDTMPGCDRVITISACSGHGFKFTPLMGRIAADMCTGRPPDYDLGRFRLARFSKR
ncbi:MAG TPA: N-methyl-L-tryptophan oxidase [Chthonomonadaceae bacterium]|nr:N-methyl-L-tryptophan oxidase [Chthonomonadaceae bacterium]